MFRGIAPPAVAAGPGFPASQSATVTTPAAIGPQVPTSKPLFPAAQVGTALLCQFGKYHK